MERYLLHLRPAFLALLLLLPACSIKEERGDCPCYLQVSFTDPEAAGTAEMLGWRDAAPLFRDRIRIEDNRPAWIKPVGKGFLTLSACKGMDRAAAEGHILRIPAGSEADSLYAWFGEVDATGDLATVQVSLRKQFATVLMDIRKPAEEVRTCRFSVDGNTGGFDLLDFSPVEGYFYCEPKPRDDESIVSFRVPRQADHSLLVTIRPDGFPPARFPLGEYIRQLGYNWKTEELQDIYVSIDLARGLVDVRIADWETGETFPLIEI